MADKIERDEPTGRDTTGHEWDGIKELDTPLPRWWLYVFYACIVAAIVYWVLMPSWPMANGYTRGILNWSDRANVAQDLKELRDQRAPMFAKLATATPQTLAASPELRTFARAAGEAAFGDNCRTCHGAGGAGRPGYPSLADDVWLWGGSQSEIEHTIRVGIRSGHPEARMSQMPAFGRDEMLTHAEIDDLTDYVISISAAKTRLKFNKAAAQRATSIFAQQCAVCHGASGAGDRKQGAPSLKDDLWLYGGSREEIQKQIELGRGGVMPSWQTRFDDGTIKALALYVYEMGGGEPEAPPAPAVETAPTPAATPISVDVEQPQQKQPEQAANTQ